jgi:hypothetical protein
MTTGNAALAWVNLFNSAVVTASSSATTTPATNLQIADIATKWRGTGGTADNVTATWASDQTADTFMFNGMGSTFLATGTVRLQGFNAAAAQVFDTTTQAGIVDPLYGYAIHLLASQTFRSLKWTFSQAGASYIEGGRAFVGIRTQFTYNMAPGASRQWMHNTKKAKSSGGQTKVDRSSPGKARIVRFNLGWVDETQRWALHEAMHIANGDHTDVLYIGDTASTNLGRDSQWGLLDSVPEVVQPFTIADLYAVQYQHEERL